MSKNGRQLGRSIAGTQLSGWARFALLWALVLLICFTVMSPEPVPAVAPTPLACPPAGKVLEELQYRVDVWIWKNALDAKVIFKEIAPGRYRAELTGRTRGFLSLVTGDWGGALSTEMQYSQGKLQPLVYREISNKRGKNRTMEYRFDYAKNKVELWKSDKDNNLAKKWESTLKGPMYDPLTFFYNRRLTGNPLGSKGGETLKFQGIPYPEPDEIVLRVGNQTPQGRKIMLELGNRVFKGERSQVYAYLDSEGVPTKAWTQVMKFGAIDIQLLPGSKRLNKRDVTQTLDQARAQRP
ncbi:MAG: DUF3108 domain-containing protein [Thermodesulfobacteriota bacterium]